MTAMSRLFGVTRPGDFDSTSARELERLLSQAENDGDGEAVDRYDRLLAQRRIREGCGYGCHPGREGSTS